jgi:hypothetical protein
VIDGARKGRGSVEECLTHAVAQAFGLPSSPMDAEDAHGAAAAAELVADDDDGDDDGGSGSGGGPAASAAGSSGAAGGVKFHGAGREDVDVRMLGRGRPFILQVLNPRVLTPLWLAAAAQAAAVAAAAGGGGVAGSAATDASTDARSGPEASVPRLLPLPAIEAAINAAAGFNARGDVEVGGVRAVASRTAA